MLYVVAKILKLNVTCANYVKKSDEVLFTKH